MKYAEIKKALNNLLKKKYPEIKIYGKEIKEGYSSPCFFTEIISPESKVINKNFEKISFTLYIAYFQEIKNEFDQLEKADEIKELFGAKFKVGDCLLTTGEYNLDYIGEYSDILRIGIDFTYLENKVKKPEGNKMEELEMEWK